MKIPRSAVTLLLSFFLCWAFPGMAAAHSMKQVRSEISVVDGKWEASIWLEGWALYPEDGPKVPPGTPGDPNTAGNDWVKTLDEADHEIMRDTAVTFIDYTYRLTLDGKPLEGDYDFPDYDVPLPTLDENDDGNALVRIDIAGELPEGAEGSFKLEWVDPEDEPLVLSIVKPEARLLRIDPRTPAVELFKLSADGTSTETEGTSLFGWIIYGFEHILPKGLDHIFFILGLFFLQPKPKPLLLQTSSFTIAHSITLALAVTGVFTVPASIVEPMIALSIAYVGLENMWTKELKPWRIGLVFGLGLLHGMGFASVMQELDIPEGRRRETPRGIQPRSGSRSDHRAHRSFRRDLLDLEETRIRNRPQGRIRHHRPDRTLLDGRAHLVLREAKAPLLHVLALEAKGGGLLGNDALEVSHFLGVHAVLHGLEFLVGALDGFFRRLFVDLGLTKRHVREDDGLVFADLCEAGADRESVHLAFAQVAELTRLKGSHQTGVIRQDTHLPIRARQIDVFYGIGEDLLLRSDDFEMECHWMNAWKLGF